MLPFHIITGTAGSGKTHTLWQELGKLPADAKAILLVPEQYSFESEKMLLDSPHPENTEVLSFSRLCHRVFSLYGGVAGTPVSEGEKVLLMSRAVHQVADRLVLYRKQQNSPEFCKHLLAIALEMQYAGITSAFAQTQSNQLPAGSLQQKIREIAMILSAYQALLSLSHTDPEEDLNRLSQTLQEHPYFEGKHVFIDSFKGFTQPQKAILTNLLATAQGVTVSLCADGLHQKHNLEVFANTKDLANWLIQTANQTGRWDIGFTRLSGNRRTNLPELVALERLLAGSIPEELPDNAPAVTICECAHPYAEADYVAHTICRLARTEHWRFSDFMVMMRKEEDYTDLLTAAFDRYHIPYFTDRNRPIVHQPMAVFTRLALSLASGKYNPDDVVALLKTGILGFTPLEIADLENYIYIWSVKAKDLKSPFTFAAPKDPPALLQTVEALRLRIMPFLEAYAKEVEKAVTAKDHAVAFYHFITACKVPCHLESFCQSMSAAGQEFESEDVLRTYDIVMELFDRAISVLGETPVSREEFAKAMETLMQTATLNKIPQGLNQVVIGVANRSRPADPKVMFVVGANQGVFPATVASGGLLSDRERLQLNQVDLPFSDHCEFDTVEESFLFYTTACAASKQVIFTYQTGGVSPLPCTPLRELVTRLSNLQQVTYGTGRLFDQLPERDLPALQRYAGEIRENTSLALALGEYFKTQKPDWHDRVKNIVGATDLSITKEHAQALFGKEMRISPSGVEAYHGCRFRYFCQYGLRLSPLRPVGLDYMSKGIVAHHVLELMLNKYGSKGLANLTPEDMQEEIHRILMAYITENMGGLDHQPATFHFQLERVEIMLITLLTRLAEEFAVTEFETAACELGIGKDQAISIDPMEIPLDDGGKLSVVGVVDRLDICKKNGTTYFRIVDYKTGTKIFDLDDLYYGIGLQMFIYLFSIQEKGERFGPNRVPAGVLYMPASRKPVDGETPEKAIQNAAKSLRMNGLVLNDHAVTDAMDATHSGRFIPVIYTKNGFDARSSLASAEFFGNTAKRIQELLTQMGMNLQAGNITCKPLDPSENKADACRYCDYKAVCPLAADTPHDKIPKLEDEQRKRLLQGGDFDGLETGTATSHR